MSSPLQITVTPEACPWGFNPANRAPTAIEEIEHAICEAGHPSPDQVLVEGAIGAVLVAAAVPVLEGFALLVGGGLLLTLFIEKGFESAVQEVKTALSNPIVAGGAALAAGWYLAPAGFLVGAASHRRRRRKRRT